MKKIAIFSFAIGSFIISAIAADAEKMTFDKATQSHNTTYGKYSAQSITEQQSQLAWDSYNQRPEESSSGDKNKKYVELFAGECTAGKTCTLSENINNYDQVVVEVRNKFDRHSTSVFPVTGVIGRYLMLATNTSGDANDYIDFRFTSPTAITHEGGKFLSVITHVWANNKLQTLPAECSAGQVQNEAIYCASPQRTCETGNRQKSCNNGYWSPSTTTRNPICVSQTQQCP